jgi:hypothetical protein
MVVKFYYEKVPQEGDTFPTKLQELMEKAMEQVRKEHYLAFYKHMTICDHALGPKFLQEIQAHYNNLELEMLTKKL